MKNLSVALIIDHPQRDLAGLVLTAYELCQRGIDCHLVPHNIEGREVWSLAPDLVVLNFFRPGNDLFARQMRKAGILFGLLDTEGGVWPSVDRYTELLWKDTDLLHSAAGVCAWGPELARHTVAHGYFTAGQMAVTGCPRFDLYHPDWRMISEGARSGKNGRLHILVNTNYSAANPRFATVDQNIAQFRRQFLFDEERVHAIIDTEEGAIGGVIAMVRRLASDFSGSCIVLRPHPFERPERYAAALADLDNVIINNEGPVQEQIFRADVVIQRSCTTAVEAFMAGIPTFSPHWLPAAASNPMSEAASIPCADYENLVLQIEKVKTGTFSVPDDFRSSADAEISRWFYQNDGAAHRRVASAFAKWLEKRTKVDGKTCRRFLYGLDGQKRGIGVKISQRLRFGFGLPSNWSFTKMRQVPIHLKKDKIFTVEQVRSVLERIGRVERSRSHDRQPVEAFSSHACGAYSQKYHGYAVTLRRGGRV